MGFNRVPLFPAAWAILLVTIVSACGEDAMPPDSKPYDLEYRGFDRVIQGAKALPRQAVERLFGDLKVRDDVSLFRVGPETIVASRTGKVFPVNWGNVGFIIEPIGSDQQARDLWHFFSADCIAVPDRTTFLQARENCLNLPNVDVSQSVPDQYGVNVVLDRKGATCTISGVALDTMRHRVFSFKHVVTLDCHVIDGSETALITGPAFVGGWPLPHDQDFYDYQARVEAFEKAVSPITESAKTDKPAASSTETPMAPDDTAGERAD
jgi:hypothetical protein